MQLAEIINIIEKTAIPSIAAEWDKSGIQVAARRRAARHMAVMLDPSLRSVSWALEMGADFILAHHPLTLRPRFADSLGGFHGVLSLLFRHDVCLYSAHTSLDANPRGPVSWLADKLGLKDRAVLEPTTTLEGAPFGFGFVGDLPQEESYNSFCALLSAALETGKWRACGPRPGKVRRVACCPGSGGDMVGLAGAAGADVYITGDVKYHTALDTEIRLLDVGHFQLEEIMMRLFAARLAALLPELQVSFLPGSDPLIFEEF
ncbi:MAG: Nif3-like dinuclear metal center hexameric protein [Deltaproteobacteria bacterium]|jgi:dinuclear metal center YbgI/SA1388 family protein|nr:Nif3-like dinuclear metal center hexameric protein [Deltaproteobacteria bacterium]